MRLHWHSSACRLYPNDTFYHLPRWGPPACFCDRSSGRHASKEYFRNWFAAPTLSRSLSSQLITSLVCSSAQNRLASPGQSMHRSSQLLQSCGQSVPRWPLPAPALPGSTGHRRPTKTVEGFRRTYRHYSRGWAGALEASPGSAALNMQVWAWRRTGAPVMGLERFCPAPVRMLTAPTSPKGPKRNSQGRAWQQFSCPASSSCLALKIGNSARKPSPQNSHCPLTQSRRRLCRSGRTRTTALTEEDLLHQKALQSQQTRSPKPSEALRCLLAKGTHKRHESACIVRTRCQVSLACCYEMRNSP